MSAQLMHAVALLLCSGVLHSAHGLDCSTAWATNGFGGIFQRFDARRCQLSMRGWKACPEGRHLTECCMSSDCDSENGMQCLCDEGCKQLTCQRASASACGGFTPPAHGSPRKLNETSMQVTCDTQYTNVPPDQHHVHCDVNSGAVWSPNIECKRKCPRLPSISNGRALSSLQGVYYVGSTAQYACRAGYSPASGTITCEEESDGTAVWSILRCRLQQCPTLDNNDRNLIVPNRGRRNFKQRQMFTCRAGFIRQGPASLTCKLHGNEVQVRWSGALPTCTARPCSVPPSSAASAASSLPAGQSVPSGGNVSYSCPEHHTLVGPAQLQCYQGVWSADAPTCKPSCCSYDFPNNTNNYTLRFSNPAELCGRHLASHVQLSCPESCHVPANVTAVCRNNTWPDDVILTCDKKTCPLLAPFVQGDVLPQATVLSGNTQQATHRQECGSILSFSCPAGKVLIPNVPTIGCQASSEWSSSPIIPVCVATEATQCPASIPLTNGSQFVSMFPEGRHHTAVAQIGCRGTCMIAGATATCSLNRTSGIFYWEVTGTPQCRPGCQNYATFASARKTRLRQAPPTAQCGDSYRVRCLKGHFKVLEQGTRKWPAINATCMANGQWSHQPSDVDVRCIRDCTDSTACPTPGTECYLLQSSPKLFSCRCAPSCPAAVHVRQAVCGSDGVIYRTRCHLFRQACTSGMNITELPMADCQSGGSCWKAPVDELLGPECSGSSTRTAYVYHDTNARRCMERPSYKCSVVEQNSFTTFRDCYKQCAIDRVCSLPPARGHCISQHLRYFYNCETSRCEQFFYSGCGGNQNNFESRRECNRVAMEQQCATNGSCHREPASCCDDERTRLLKMCNDSVFAITANMRYREVSRSFHVYQIRVNRVLYGGGTLTRNGELVSQKNFLVVSSIRDPPCRDCVYFPRHVSTQVPMFLMGTVASDYLYVGNNAFGYSYTQETEGRETICGQCPASSNAFQAAGCGS